MEKKIFICFLFAALLITAGCRKDDTPAEVKTPVGFRAMSQAVWVKSDPKPLSDFHSDFGVWGIARHSEISSPYILWTSDDLTQVTKNNAANAPANQYIPTEDAYWLSGYEYTFLAVAPYDDTGMSDVSFTLKDATGNTTGKDLMTFTYDLSSKYTQNTPQSLAFDLLGAAAETQVSKASTQGAQPITFWHLLSQINISTSFSTGLDGEPIDGEVTAIYLEDVVAVGDYTIYHAAGDQIEVLPVPSSAANAKKNLTFNGSTALFNIIPQDVKNLGLYLDFRINEGNSNSKSWVEYRRFKVNLNVAANNDPYTYNGRYNWIITIGTGAAIKFNVTVTPWESVNNIPEIGM